MSPSPGPRRAKAALTRFWVELASWFLPVSEPWVETTGLVSLLLFLFVVLGHTLRRGPVSIHRIQGAVAAYLLLGIVWAYAYSLLAHARPGAFAGAVSATDGAPDVTTWASGAEVLATKLASPL